MYGITPLQSFAFLHATSRLVFAAIPGKKVEKHYLEEYASVVVNFYFQLHFSFPLFLCILMYGNVHKTKEN